MSVLAFFGYNKIENIEETILQQANARLSITDSLLAKINQTKIDSLNQVLLLKEEEYKTTIENLERVVKQSMALQQKLFEMLPENKSIDIEVKSFIEEDSKNVFIVNSFNKNLIKNQTEFICLVFKDNVEFTKDDFISISLYPKGRRILVFNKKYQVSSILNKASFSINPFEKYTEYVLEISFFKKVGDQYKRYCQREEVSLKS